MSRSHKSRRGCGRGCGVCAALVSDLPKIEAVVATRELRTGSDHHDDDRYCGCAACDGPIFFDYEPDDDEFLIPSAPLRVPLAEVARDAS